MDKYLDEKLKKKEEARKKRNEYSKNYYAKYRKILLVNYKDRREEEKYGPRDL